MEPASELLAMNGTQILEYECREQPGKLRELIAAYKDNPEIREQLRAMREMAARSTAPVMFIGMGGSLCRVDQRIDSFTESWKAGILGGCRRVVALCATGVEGSPALSADDVFG